MRAFLTEFERRSLEVRRYIAVLAVTDRALSESDHRKYGEDLKVFRAGALLVIYNAIEASARSGVQAIYDAISETGTTFDQLNDELRVRILTDFSANKGKKSYSLVQNVAIDLISFSFDAQKLFSGNVDAQKIRETADHFGFVTDSEHSVTKHGADLLTVKSRRQDLAHGNLSFSDVGKQYSTTDIKRISRHSLAYMRAILRNIDSYLEEQAYKKRKN